MPLNGACLPDGRRDARYANLHHSLVIAIGHIVLQGEGEALLRHQLTNAEELLLTDR